MTISQELLALAGFAALEILVLELGIVIGVLIARLPEDPDDEDEENE